MKRVKVAILNDVINEPYNALFTELAKSKDYQFCVFYCFANESDIRQKMEFDFEVLPKWQLPLIKTELQFAVNPTILWELIKFNPEVVIIMGWDLLSYWLAFLLAKISGKKIILWSGSTRYEKSLQRNLSLPLVKYLVSHVDSCLSYGSRAYQYLLALGVKKEKIFLAHNTVDIDFFINQREYRVTGKKVILFVGQLIERKGVFDLLKAFKGVIKEEPKATLLFVGEGEMKKQLRSYSQRNRLEEKVRFLGKVAYSQLPEVYSMADVFVLPSHEEVWGLVVNEAMACGLPVVVSDRVGAGEDLVKHGENGFVFPAGNIKILTYLLRKILHDSALREKMGQKSQAMIRPFNNKNRAKSFFQAIRFALEYA